MTLKRLANETAALELVYRVICWSFEILATGRWPSNDHCGRAFLHGYRADLADTLLAPSQHDPNVGYRGFFYDVVGDLKWLCEACQLKWHYGTHSMCHLCCACKLPGPDLFSDFSDSAWMRRRRRTADEYAATLLLTLASLPWLSRLPGWTIFSNKHDVMHMDHLGVAQWLAANALVHLVDVGAFGPMGNGKYVERMNRCLRRAWVRFNAWAKANKLGHRERQFTCARLSMKASTDWPTLKSKAHSTTLVCRWLATEMSGRNELPLDQLSDSCFQSWVCVQHIMSSRSVNSPNLMPTACS